MASFNLQIVPIRVPYHTWHQLRLEPGRTAALYLTVVMVTVVSPQLSMQMAIGLHAGYKLDTQIAVQFIDLLSVTVQRLAVEH